MENTLREKVTANLSKIKVALGMDEAPEETVELEDIRKVDGTILRIEPAIEVGATVQVIGEDAELIEAPDGDHELESGDVIKTEGGVIIEVIAVEGEPEEVVEEEMSEEAPVKEPTVKAIDVEELTNNVMNRLNEAITDKINNLKFAAVEEVETLKEKNKTLTEAVTELVGIVEEFAATPSEEPKKGVKNPFKKDKKEFDFSKIGKALNKINK
jgi:predicted trehalose synthase